MFVQALSAIVHAPMIDWAGIFGYDPGTPLIFTQFFFWGFFAVVLVGYSLVYRNRAVRNAYLFAVSLFFYWKTSGLFIGILLFSTFADMLIGLRIYGGRTQLIKRLWLALSIALNLLVLGFFKYAHFVTENINNLLGTTFHPVNIFAQWANMAWDAHFVENKILLPVGISFYTFQTMSYAIDVYRNDVKPVRNLLDFGFYVSFFPQLVAGPIVRAAEFIPQMYEEFKLTRAQFGIAVFWIMNGLAKKILIGDYIAVNFIDRVFADPMRYTGFEGVMALYGYSLQVYADFSGYTDIAIGVALLMGFTLPVNFNSPYKAASTAEFWKRWHISLSTWLRDYLYIPMGGNRGGSLFSWIMLGIIGAAFVLLTGWLWLPVIFISVLAFFAVLTRLFPPVQNLVTTNLNLMITMLVGGLWHGASWMFVIWGGLNGLGLVIYKFWKRVSPWDKSSHWFARVQAIAITFTFITFTRIWFRSDSLTTANHLIHQITHDFGAHLMGDVLWGFRSVFLVMLAGLIIHWLPETFKQRYRTAFAGLPLWAMAGVCVVIVATIYQTMTAEMVPFIYFQF
ncbi:MAG TPA: MBOAT family O-acyltransferase [Flavobacteriales bacterium]|nr:MBOAT family O-acyltransferase [Flavobacteriales bacterium]